MNLMEWSLSQTGRMNFNPEYFEMKDTVDKIVLLFTDIAEQKSIIIKSELIPKIPVYADKAMVNTILRNLVSNAVKFSVPGGNVIISAEERQNEVIVKISDTGAGIPESVIENLFLVNGNYSTLGTQNERGTAWV
jgi:signal transduction histidine kinase